MQTNRRWLKAVIAASLDPQAPLPFQRAARRKPLADRPAPGPAKSAAAAR